MATIKVCVIEDDPGTLEVLKAMIDGWPALTCVSGHTRPAQALVTIPGLRPDVVLVDLELGRNGSGIECIRQLKEKLSATQFLVYSKHDHGRWIFPALREGASGYILKDEPPSVLLEAIHAAHRGESPMSSQIARLVLQYFRNQREAARELEKLTPRQIQILELATRGARDSDIARELGIGVRTVGAHFRQIYETLHAKCRAGAVAKFASAQSTI